MALFITSQNLSAQDLPKGPTEQEKLMMQSYVPPISPFAFTQPPSVPVRTMAEWEELQGVMITWTSQITILRQIVDYVQDECMVYIVCSDSNSVKNTLTSNGIPLTNITFMVAPFNSIWIRDYGPWSVYANNTDSLYIVDWIYNRPRPNDDNIPVVFATRRNIPVYQTTVSPNNLTATGGNFMVDGHGTGFSSKLILNENTSKTEAQIDTIMKKFMGLNRYIKMEVLPYDEIHHIDMHIKLLDEETLLVGQYPPGVADGPQIEANLQYVLSNFKTVYGRDFKVVRIPMPPDGQGRYPNNNGDYRTYTNSVIVNKTVIVPTYEVKYDTTALRIYREAMPGYRIVGINCNAIITSLGAIHCITKEVGVPDPVFISVFPLVQTGRTGFEAKIYIKAAGGTANPKLHWGTAAGGPFTEVSLSGAVQDTFFTTFYVPESADTVYYYVSASGSNGRTVTKPLVAPGGVYKHKVDVTLPVELTAFTADWNGSQIVLRWSTASEVNNRGFEIERRTEQTVWQTIGFINGAGNTAENKQYRFNDYSITKGKLYYRLKQYDYSGEFSYSSVIEVEPAAPAVFSLDQNYPNPFNPETEIRFSIPAQGNVLFEIYNIYGELIQVPVNRMLPAGGHSVRFNAAGLATGVYYSRLTASGQTAVRKMLYLK